jgi:hypothetical protein
MVPGSSTGSPRTIERYRACVHKYTHDLCTNALLGLRSAPTVTSTESIGPITTKESPGRREAIGPGKEPQMNTSMRTRSIVAMLVIGAVAPVASAAADGPAERPVYTATPPAEHSDSEYLSLNAISHPASEPSSQAGSTGREYQSLNAISHPVSEPTNSQAGTGTSSLNSIVGAPTSEPTLVSSPSGSNDGFNWGDAALGAGAAMAALLALGSAGLLVARRRTGVPSTS